MTNNKEAYFCYDEKNPSFEFAIFWGAEKGFLRLEIIMNDFTVFKCIIIYIYI